VVELSSSPARYRRLCPHAWIGHRDGRLAQNNQYGSLVEVNSIALNRCSVFADLAAPGEGVLVQVMRGLCLTEHAEVRGEVTGRIQRAGMVVAQNAASAGEGVLV